MDFVVLWKISIKPPGLQIAFIMNSFFRFIHRLFSPVRREPVFFAVTFAILCLSCFLGLIKVVKTAEWLMLSEVGIGLLRGLFYAYILAGVVVVAKRRWVKWTLYSILLFVAFCDITVKAIWGLSIFNLTVIKLIAETNVTEATDMMRAFFGWKMIMGLGGFVASLAVVAWLERILYGKFRLNDRKLPTWTQLAVLACVAAGAVYMVVSLRILGADSFSDIERYYPGTHTDMPTKLLSNIASVRTEGKEVEQWQARVKADLKPGRSEAAPTDTVDVVVVIGESFIKSHSQVYGYRLATTPFQAAERAAGRLVAYSDARSAFSNTSGSMLSFFSLNVANAGEEPLEGTFWPVLYRNAGWDIYMLDNQHTEDSGIFNFTISGILHSDFISKNVYSYTSEYSNIGNDLDFVKKEFAKASEKKPGSPKRLWIYHLWGQHVQAANRYPHTPQYSRFLAKDYGFRREPWLCDCHKEIIAHYDNATYFNDRVLKQIVENHKDRPAVILYFSDHGEEVYDYRPSQGRVRLTAKEAADKAMAENYIRSIFEVPMEFWMSERYMAKYPEKASLIRGAAERSASVDHLGHTMLFLGGIESPKYRKKHDVLSEEYAPAKASDSELLKR